MVSGIARIIILWAIQGISKDFNIDKSIVAISCELCYLGKVGEGARSYSTS